MNKAVTIIIERLKRGSTSARMKLSSLEKPVIVPLEKIDRENLQEKMMISQQLVEELLAESELLECEHKATGILSRRDHSVGELKHKLRLKKFGESAINRVVSIYKRKGILDDRSYAEKVVTKILEQKPSGKPYLISLLRQKMIHRELAEETVQALYDDENDIALAVAALSKRWRQYCQFELEEARRKAYNYLSRRGFSYSTAKEAFDQLWQQVEEER